MKYQIKGEPMPVVICHLDRGETVTCEAGAMSWMTPTMEMQTSGGGLGKMFGRMMSGENAFQNHYVARKGEGMIAFASKFPGAIKAFEITPSTPVICQKKSFLACSEGVELSVHFQKKLGAGLFGGEGFVLQRLSGEGLVFLELDGAIQENELQAGEKLIVDTGNVALFESQVSYSAQMVKGFKNILFGGEGLFLTTLTGPGKVWLQTLTASELAKRVIPFIPTSSN